jgi:hypothetical protein
MNSFPNALERWLQSQDNPSGNLPSKSCPSQSWTKEGWPQESGLKETWIVEGWQIKVLAGPPEAILRGIWPQWTIVATLGASDSNPSIAKDSSPKDTWLVFPNSAAVPQTPPKGLAVWLSENSTKILHRILNAKDSQELACFCNPIPIGLVQPSDPDQSPWIAWHISALTNSPSAARWELLDCVLDRLGLPPALVLCDWKKQLKEWKLISEDSNIDDSIWGMAHQLLVSKSGLLIPLGQFQVRELEPSDCSIPPAPSKLVSMIPSVTKNERKTKGLSTKIWLGLGLAILPIGLAMGLILGQTGSTLAPAPDTPSQSIQPTTLAQIASEPTTPPEPPAEPPIFRTELDRFETPLTDFDPQAESIATVVQNSLDVNIRLASTQDPAEELPAPEQKPLQPVNIQEAKADSEESTLVISHATQKREFRVPRGFSAKKAKGIFTLELDEDLDDKLHVLGPKTQELVGESSGSWRISMDDSETELILTLQSKPGPKWQVSTLVQIPSAPSGPPVSLGPKEPTFVLERLAQYNQWLQQSADQWKLTASGSTKPGQPSPIQLARMYSAKQKETQRAIQRWRQIEQLAALVFDSVRVQVDLQPEPAQTP